MPSRLVILAASACIASSLSAQTLDNTARLQTGPNVSAGQLNVAADSAKSQLGGIEKNILADTTRMQESLVAAIRDSLERTVPRATANRDTVIRVSSDSIARLQAEALAMERIADSVTRAWRDVAIYARDHEHLIDQALLVQQRFPAASGGLAASDKAHQAIAFASIDSVWLNKHVEQVVPDTVRRAAIRNDARALRRMLRDALVRQNAPVYVTVFADGNVRNVLSGKADEASSGSGMLGMSVRLSRALVTGKVSVTPSMDTVRSDHGGTLLAPGTGRAFSSGIISVYWSPPPAIPRQIDNRWKEVAVKSGRILINSLPRQLYAFTGKTLWHYDRDTTAAVDTVKRAATLVGLGALWGGGIARGRIADNPLSFEWSIGPALRSVSGNVRMDAPALKSAVLGTDRRWFVGPEAGFSLSFNAVTAAIHWYYLVGRNKEQVDGLTHGQVVGGIAVSGDLLSGPLLR